MRNILSQKKIELESMIQEAEVRLEEQEEVNAQMQAEKSKLTNEIHGLEEQ